MSKTVFLLTLSLFLKTTYAQVFIAQRVVYTNDFTKTLVNKNINYNVTSLILDRSYSSIDLDTCHDLLIDANYSLDSFTLIYKTPREKVYQKRIYSNYKIITPTPPIKPQDKYLICDDENMSNCILKDSFENGIYNQDVLSYYEFDSIGVGISKITGLLRIFKNNRLTFQLLGFNSVKSYGSSLSHEKKYISDYSGNKILYIVLSKGKLLQKIRGYLLEIDIQSGHILYKSPFKEIENAFYFFNEDMVIISSGYDCIGNHAYLYEKKTKKISVLINNQFVINMIPLNLKID